MVTSRIKEKKSRGMYSMIISQTPVRISLFGGGTDISSYYKLQSPGMVLNSSINKYIYVTVKKNFFNKIAISSEDSEVVSNNNEIHHDLVRETMRYIGIESGVDISIMSDVPSNGTGLGSSSALTVGLLHSLLTLKKRTVTAEELARLACEIEIDVLGAKIGKQDQYIAAYGGLKIFQFYDDESVSQTDVLLTDQQLKILNSNLLLFYTGRNRSASHILGNQHKKAITNAALLSAMKKHVDDALEFINLGELDSMGGLLDINWKLKRQLAEGISNKDIDDLYKMALECGARGGKITGAGGGGFLLLYCPLQYQLNLRDALHGYQELNFNLTNHGSKIIYNDELDT